jgi:hypothetical protein
MSIKSKGHGGRALLALFAGWSVLKTLFAVAIPLIIAGRWTSLPSTHPGPRDPGRQTLQARTGR